MTAIDVKSAKPFEYKVKKENPSPRQMRPERRVINCIMVEAAGVEPASENIPVWFLRAYPDD
ncbi:MAG: hypothetical protein PVI60_03640 [Desulfobacteraceae bacterium]|jgi:hypothetical protein